MPEIQLLSIPEQTPRSEIDEEIIEIFIEEVDEVLEEIVTNLNVWKNNLENSESLKTLRRAFHTLKGSGRLVGATAIGELGWRFENMLNHVINGTRTVHDDMLTILEQVEKVLPNLIKQFQHNQTPDYQALILITQADYLTQNNEHRLDGLTVVGGEPSDDSTPNSKTTSENDLQSANETVIKQETVDSQRADEPQAVSDDKQPKSNIETPKEEEDDFSISENQPLLEKPLTDEFPEEPGNESESATTEFPEWSDNDLELTTDAFPDLPDTEIDLGTEALSELPDGEFELNLDDFPDLPNGEFELSDETFPDSLDNEFELEEETLADGSESEPQANDEMFSEDKTFETISLPTDDSSVTDNHSSLEEEEDTIDQVVLEVFKNEARERLVELKNSLEQLQKQSPALIDQDIVRVFHTLNGSSRSVDFWAISEIAAPMEGYARTLFEQQTELSSDMVAIFNEAARLIEELLDGKTVNEEQQKKWLEQVQTSLETMPNRTPPPKEEPPKPTSPPPAEDIPDATDEFMAIFLDEADEIIENTQPLLERWQTAPKNMQLIKELQRELHTLKGGARMVGIVPMGNLSHHLESVLTRIVEGVAESNSQLQDIIQNSVDELAAMLEAVRSGVPLEMPEDLIQKINSALGGEEQETEEAPVKKAATPASKEEPPSDEDKAADETTTIDKQPIDKEGESIENAEDRIRVRGSLIDKLTNLAGELSISRAHMEQQQGTIKNHLEEMEETVIRLRDQLRRLEIETEAQIISHFSGTKELDENEEFDPLELDRFSTLQQLSRSLMESVNDLSNIQEYLKNQTRQSDSLLIQQSRIGAELQENIMRTRMIPFARISPRLQRIARLTARELHKQVNFVINGENTEFERTVLDRIVAPHEHLLRNAIKHGIEDAPTRQQAGKPSIGKITIDLFREGTELIIRLSDDGSGLDLPAIRKKAEQQKLIQPDMVIDDHELMQFILQSGFSTAKTVDQVAGRGVGMDVVSTEIKQLGGSLQIQSKTGQGTTFEIRLPLSLTINQALLVHVGDETMAVPMNHVDAVMRAQRTEVLSEPPTSEARYYNYMDNKYRIFHMGELLGFGQTSLVETPLIPMLLARAGDRRVALLVDGIEGSKEIVVKSVGPQIDKIRWISGATILGDGRVVLILDMPVICRADTSQPSVPSQVEEVVIEEKPIAKTIMVVDDSITVRKVTARLLKRQGMEVLMAKDGLDAVTQLQENVPDLMLLDVEMPRMDGYELATTMRNNPDWKPIPIIMITSRTGAKHREKAEKIGIDRYLGKPFNETELLENINALLA
jgi:chemosensory pili system protein ChpA (sensor histidine kinase/response regulator)